MLSCWSLAGTYLLGLHLNRWIRRCYSLLLHLIWILINQSTIFSLSNIKWQSICLSSCSGLRLKSFQKSVLLLNSLSLMHMACPQWLLWLLNYLIPLVIYLNVLTIINWSLTSIVGFSLICCVDILLSTLPNKIRWLSRISVKDIKPTISAN